MRVTKAQKLEMLPVLQKIVQGRIDQWEGEAAIEGILGKQFDGMTEVLDSFAVTYDSGEQVTIQDVQSYVDSLTEGN